MFLQFLLVGTDANELLIPEPDWLTRSARHFQQHDWSSVDGHFVETSIEPRCEQAQQPVLQILVTYLCCVRHKACTDHSVADVGDAPHEVGTGLAEQRGRVGQGGDILTDLSRFSIVELELDPFGLLRQSAQLAHETLEVLL